MRTLVCGTPTYTLLLLYRYILSGGMEYGMVLHIEGRKHLCIVIRVVGSHGAHEMKGPT